jgi:DNA-binding NtrC family response regulator
MKPKTRKVMIVCSEISDDLDTHLVGAGWVVIWADNGKAAISKVRREDFDMAVLISTGKEMDVTETLFNLRDIRESMPIVIVRQPDGVNNSHGQESYLHSTTKVLSVQGVDGLVKLLKDKDKAERTMGLL